MLFIRRFTNHIILFAKYFSTMYCKLPFKIYIFAMHNKTKHMKKLALIICSVLLTFSAMAIQGDSDKIYQKLKSNNKETFSMSLSKNMIDFFDMDLDFNGKEKLITGDFHEGKMLVLEEVKSVATIRSTFESNDYELVESDEDEVNIEDGEAYLYINRKGATVSEAHFVIVSEDKVTILSVYGDIKVKNKN